MAGKKTVKLVNLSGMTQTFNLPHEQYCLVARFCSCRTATNRRVVRNPRTGVASFKDEQRRVPKVITLRANTESEFLHEAALDCPEVNAALSGPQPRIRVKR